MHLQLDRHCFQVVRIGRYVLRMEASQKPLDLEWVVCVGRLAVCVVDHLGLPKSLQGRILFLHR